MCWREEAESHVKCANIRESCCTSLPARCCLPEVGACPLMPLGERAEFVADVVGKAGEACLVFVSTATGIKASGDLGEDLAEWDIGPWALSMEGCERVFGGCDPADVRNLGIGT